MPDARGNTILILVGPEYEDLEVWYPKLRLEEAGFETKLAGIGESTYRGKHGYPATMDGHVRDFPATQLAGIIAPGGWAPDKLRRDLDVLTRVREVHSAGKLVGTICHGPWILISAGIVRGQRSRRRWASATTSSMPALHGSTGRLSSTGTSSARAHSIRRRAP